MTAPDINMESQGVKDQWVGIRPSLSGSFLRVAIASPARFLLIPSMRSASLSMVSQRETERADLA